MLTYPLLLFFTPTQGTHNLYKQPEAFRPERFMPNGEYDQFDEAIRPYMFVPFIQVCNSGPAWLVIFPDGASN